MFGINTTTTKAAIHVGAETQLNASIQPLNQTNYYQKQNTLYGCERAPDSTPPSSITPKQKKR
jgi:hypothetical protein